MSDEIQLAPNKLMTTKTTDNEKLIWYLQGKLKRTDISKKLEEKLSRFNHCADYIKKYGSRLKVVPMMEKKFGLSTAQAYRDYNDTQQVFATTEQNNQAFWVDMLLGDIRQALKAARKDEDHKAVAALIKTMKETIKELLGDASAAIYDDLVPPVPVLGFFPEELKVPMPDDLQEQLKRFKVKKKTNTIDVEFEEVKEDPL